MIPSDWRWLVFAQLLGIFVIGIQGSSPLKELAPLTLTDAHLCGFFRVPPETLTAAPPVLYLAVTKVVNPRQTPFEVFVYLSSGRKELEQKILVGNFSLYPPDHPAGFLLNAADAFRALKKNLSKPRDGTVELRIEMRRINESLAWTPLEVTFAPPDWRNDKHH